MAAVALSVALAVSALVVAAPSAEAARRIPAYRSCKALNRVYPQGIARPRARDRVKPPARATSGWKVSAQGYRVNRRLDRDRDGIACERPRPVLRPVARPVAVAVPAPRPVVVTVTTSAPAVTQTSTTTATATSTAVVTSHRGVTAVRVVCAAQGGNSRFWVSFLATVDGRETRPSGEFGATVAYAETAWDGWQRLPGPDAVQPGTVVTSVDATAAAHGPVSRIGFAYAGVTAAPVPVGFDEDCSAAGFPAPPSTTKAAP